jgi:RecA-family ATPase
MIHPEDFVRPFNILTPSHAAWLNSLVTTHHPEVVIIDVLREIHNADENDSTAMKIVGDHLAHIFRDCTLILVHHSRKISEDVFKPDPSSFSRGSSYLTGKVDAIWLLWNNQLTIQDRMSESQTIKLRQRPSGLWENMSITSVVDS